MTNKQIAELRTRLQEAARKHKGDADLASLFEEMGRVLPLLEGTAGAEPPPAPSQAATHAAKPAAHEEPRHGPHKRA